MQLMEKRGEKNSTMKKGSVKFNIATVKFREKLWTSLSVDMPQGDNPKIACMHTESEATAKATVQRGARKAAAENLCDLELAEFCFDTTWVFGFRHFYLQSGSGQNHNISSCYAPWHKRARALCGWCQVSSRHHIKHEWTGWGAHRGAQWFWGSFWSSQSLITLDFTLFHTHIYNT